MNDRRKPQYVFFYPSIRIGGAQLLFSRLAEGLINAGYKVVILEFKEKSFIHQYIEERNLLFDFTIVSENEKYGMSENELYVLSLSDFWDFRIYVTPKKQTRFVFWDLHPNALVNSLIFSNIYKMSSFSFLSACCKLLEKGTIRGIREFIEKGTRRSAVYFMCKRNLLFNKNLFNFHIKPLFLPIPIPENYRLINYEQSICERKNEINISWLGRIEADKIRSLELLIEDVKIFNRISGYKIRLHIIGDGSLLKQINADENLVVIGKLFGKELDKYLNLVDIGFAMGTSALEFAIRKIPTVLLPSPVQSAFFSKTKKRYIWLFDSDGFDLSVDKSYNENGKSRFFYDIIRDYHKSDYTKLSLKSFDHAHANHSFETIIKNFIRYSINSQFTYNDIEKLHQITKKPYYYKVLQFIRKTSGILYKKCYVELT
ncbi:glycosyltransferase family 1 protein [Phocaeicola abscessus]|uniref:glycosyltransferase family 1 protein n=1 Tax=Phocaeicola abscessus TaxID=555313 RepID=UPI0004B9D84E|nr:glycosyltransferase family 1 protein [Phocaeicola abscessus]